MRSPGTDSGRAKCGQSGALEVRCSEHSVFGSLHCIIVFVEVRLPSGSWACVPAREDALTVMPGTLIEYLTAGQAQDVLKACQSDAGWFAEQKWPLLVREDDVEGSCIVSRIRGPPWQQILDGFPSLSRLGHVQRTFMRCCGNVQYDELVPFPGSFIHTGHWIGRRHGCFPIMKRPSPPRLFR